MKTSKGILVVISGPSGVGKSTICREVVKRTGARLSVSMTTRPPAPSEVGGRDYYFVSKDEFEKLINENQLLEYAEVFENYYGTPARPVLEAVEEGKTVILEIDVQGGMQIKARFPEALTIFILPPTQEHLAERLNGRGRDSEEVARRRLEAANDEIASAWQHYERMVVNEDLETAINEVISIIEEHKNGDKHD